VRLAVTCSRAARAAPVRTSSSLGEGPVGSSSCSSQDQPLQTPPPCPPKPPPPTPPTQHRSPPTAAGQTGHCISPAACPSTGLGSHFQHWHPGSNWQQQPLMLPKDPCQSHRCSHPWSQP
jgi:hypothetical protein